MIKVIYYFMSHLETFYDFKRIEEILNLHFKSLNLLIESICLWDNILPNNTGTNIAITLINMIMTASSNWNEMTATKQMKN